MTSLDELRNERIKKLTLLKEKGMFSYPISSHRDYTLKEVGEKFSTLVETKKKYSLVGRVKRLRRQGGMIFFHIDDGTASFQGAFKKDEIAEDVFLLFANSVDIGDFIECKGTLFVTKRGEKTLLTLSWKMLAKSIRPLPDKWHGLSDIEERFRKRYLDLLMSEETKSRFLLRSQLTKEIRLFFDEKEYVEVETPVLQPLYGGGNALPFTTHHNALGQDLYLRISNELYLKRLLIGGMPKVYEIYKGFRNEGVDSVHYPEFTMLEFYESFTDAKEQMRCVESLIKKLVEAVTGSTSFVYGEHTIDCNKKFTVVSFYDVLKCFTNISDPANTTHDEWVLEAKKLGLSTSDGESKTKIMDNIFKKVCRPHITEPTFLVGYPKEYLPLAKEKEDDSTLADAFQLVIGGIELAKGYSELNDPFVQREHFKAQEVYREKGEKDAQPLDEDYIEAMEYGMPPAGGVGIGIDRLAMLFSGVTNIKEVILFPTMKTKK